MPPSRSRRRLNVGSPTKIQRVLSSPDKNHCRTAPSTSSTLEPNATPLDNGAAVSKLDRRLTRSASKRWLKIYESSVPMLQDAGQTVSSSSMLPPPQPAVVSSKLSSGGMLTRRRYRSLRNGRGSTTDVNKISQNLFKRLSFDQISNTSDYGTASEHSRKCSVASGGMSPVSDSGQSCHCASISGIESLGTSSGDDTPSDTNDTEWVEKPWATRVPSVSVHHVEGVAAFIPDANRSEFCGDFKVSIQRGHQEDLMYR